MNKQLDFSEITIYCGVDVHKKSYVNIPDSEFELEDFTQKMQMRSLHKHSGTGVTLMQLFFKIG